MSEGAFFDTEDQIPTNILDATELFMVKAQQLNEIGFNEVFWSDPERRLRRKLLTEEYNEYRTAENQSDLVEIVDGLLDVIVIAWGTILKYVGPEKAKAAAREVYLSNLKKVLGEGLPIFREDGKVIKPEGWEPPNIAGVLWGS